MKTPATARSENGAKAKLVKLAIAGGCLVLAGGLLVWQLMPTPIATPAASTSTPTPTPSVAPGAQAQKTRTDGAPKPDEPQTPSPPSGNTAADSPRGNYRVAPK